MNCIFFLVNIYIFHRSQSKLSPIASSGPTLGPTIFDEQKPSDPLWDRRYPHASPIRSDPFLLRFLSPPPPPLILLLRVEFSGGHAVLRGEEIRRALHSISLGR